MDDDDEIGVVDTKQALSVVSCLTGCSKENLMELVGVAAAISSSSRSSAMSCSTWLSSAAEVARLLHNWPDVDSRVDWCRTGGGGGVMGLVMPGFGDLGGCWWGVSWSRCARLILAIVRAGCGEVVEDEGRE